MSQYDQLMAERTSATPLPVRATDIPRTWTEAFIDHWVSFNRGARNVAGGLAGLPVDAINFVNQANPARLAPESWGWHPRVLPQPQIVRDFQSYMRTENQREHDQFLSEKAKRQMQEFDQTDGFWDATNYAVTNPSFLGMTAVEQVPQLAMAVPGRIQATIALQSGLAGSMNANETRNELDPRVAAGEMLQQEADRRATTVFTGTFTLNAGTSLLPGAQTLERLAAGQAAHIPAGRAAGQIATSIAGEAAQGGFTEAGEQILQNLAIDRPWNEDAGKVAALGAMLEGPLGGAGRGVEVMVSYSNQAPIPPTLAIEADLPKIAPILQSDGFRRWYGERSIEQLEADYAKRDDTDGGRRIDTDIVRELAPDYAADRSRSGEVHEYASALTKELFARALAKPPSPDRAPVVAFLAGGGGSGKSTAGKAAIDAINPDIIVDGTLANLNRAHREIGASLASGRDVNIVYVYRSPEKSVEGAIDRAISRGRPVPVDALAEAHANAPQTVKALSRAYQNNGRVGIVAIWNDGEFGTNKPLPIEEIPDVNRQQAEHTFRTAVESANSAGRLPASLYKGFLPTRSLDTRDRQENERNRPEQPTRHPVTFDGDTSKVEEAPNVNQQHAEHTFRSTVESANVAGRLSPKLYAAFRGGEASVTTGRKMPDWEMDHETGRNHQPGEEDAQTHRKNEATRPQQHARDPITDSDSNTAADDEHVGTAPEPETGPAQEAPHAAELIHATPASAPTLPVIGPPIATASPQPAQPIDPQQQRQIQAEAFKQDPTQAAETFPGLASAHNTYQSVATRAASMRSPQRRDNLLSLLKNKLAQRIQHGQRIPSPKQVVIWASNLVNGRSRGD